MTYTTSLIVMLLSAMLVARITCHKGVNTQSVSGMCAHYLGDSLRHWGKHSPLLLTRHHGVAGQETVGTGAWGDNTCTHM